MKELIGEYNKLYIPKNRLQRVLQLVILLDIQTRAIFYSDTIGIAFLNVCSSSITCRWKRSYNNDNEFFGFCTCFWTYRIGTDTFTNLSYINYKEFFIFIMSLCSVVARTCFIKCCILNAWCDRKKLLIALLTFIFGNIFKQVETFKLKTQQWQTSLKVATTKEKIISLFIK